MGDNRTFSVSQSFASPYQLCDNRWHSVKANYVENALTLKVDHQDEQYGFSSNGHVKEAKTRNPLFIGGLPGTSSPIYFDFLFSNWNLKFDDGVDCIFRTGAARGAASAR